MSWKTSLLVRSDIIRLYFNLLIASDKYSRNIRENFPQPVQTNHLRNRNFWSNFRCVFANDIKWRIWKKKALLIIALLLRYYCWISAKLLFFKCQKDPVSEHLSAFNMLTGYCLKLYSSTFIHLLHHSHMTTRSHT